MNDNAQANSQRALRNAFGGFATGITVVTGIKNGSPVGMTVNSFSSVSLEPPLVSWCLGDQATLFDFFRTADFFAVNILARDQQALSRSFANSEDDCFEKARWTPGLEGLPLLAGCIANFQCQVEHRYPGGDHIILVGRVLAFNHDPAEPLVFFGGKYRTLTTETG